MRLSSQRRWLLALSLAVAALSVPVAQATQNPDVQAAAREAHWKREDALYGSRHEMSQAQTAAQLQATHWKHEDALYGARDLAAGAQRSAARTVAATGFDWSVALSGAGSAVALIIVGAVATIGIRRRQGWLAQS